MDVRPGGSEVNHMGLASSAARGAEKGRAGATVLARITILRVHQPNWLRCLSRPMARGSSAAIASLRHPGGRPGTSARRPLAAAPTTPDQPRNAALPCFRGSRFRCWKHLELTCLQPRRVPLTEIPAPRPHPDLIGPHARDTGIPIVLQHRAVRSHRLHPIHGFDRRAERNVLTQVVPVHGPLWCDQLCYADCAARHTLAPRASTTTTTKSHQN